MSELQSIQRVHDLKTDRHLWASVALKRKTFEIRFDDRDFREGDDLLLRAHVRSGDEPGYTGEWSFVHVEYIMKETQYGLKSGYVVMAIRQLMYGHSDEWKAYPAIKNHILVVS